MKKMKKLLALLICAVMLTSLVPLVPVAHAADKMGDESYEKIANIYATSGCSTMQGMAVGKTYAYTAQVNSNDSRAIITQVNLETGKTRVMLNGEDGEKVFTYLSHANDMDVVEVDGKEWLIVAAGEKLEVFEVDDGVLNHRAEYTVWYNGKTFGPTGMSVYEINEREITFLFKGGYAISKGSIPIDSLAGDIDVQIVCQIDINKVPLGDGYEDLSHYLNQGFEYRDGIVYVVFAGCSRAETINHSMIIGFDVTKGKRTMQPLPDKVFYIKSDTFKSLFEMETCGFTPDGRLVFNTNSSVDGVFVLKDFVFAPEDPSAKHTYIVRFDGSGAAGEMTDAAVTYGDIVSLPKQTFAVTDSSLTGWTAKRASDNAVYCVNKKDKTDVKWLAEADMGEAYKLYSFADGGKVMNMSETAGDVITLTAHWQLYGDVNEDGKLTIADALALGLYANEWYPITLLQRRRMDVNGDGDVNISDARCLFAYIAGAIEKLPVCE